MRANERKRAKKGGKAKDIIRERDWEKIKIKEA